jgi:hypothetical protein
MRHTPIVIALTVLGALAAALPASAVSTVPFRSELDRDGSTIQLSVAGTLCPQGSGHAPGVGSATFAVIDGTGRFAGATGTGSLSVQATGVPLLSDTAHYNGTLTLA